MIVEHVEKNFPFRPKQTLLKAGLFAQSGLFDYDEPNDSFRAISPSGLEVEAGNE